MIHKIDHGGSHNGKYLISSHKQWLPGIFEDEKAARYALQFSNDALETLAHRICAWSTEDRTITTEDLRAYRKTFEGMKEK